VVEREEVTQRLEGAGTLWAATVALLGLWRERRPSAPARDTNDDRYDAWAGLAAAVVDRFGERDVGAIDGGDREQLAAWVAGSPLGVDGGVTDAIARLGANVVCVPAMSEKTDSFTRRASELVAEAQAATIVANGPLRWGDRGLVEPVAVFGQPIEGMDPSVSPAGRPIAAPCASVFKLGQVDVDVLGL
jgi:hypothetical protein